MQNRDESCCIKREKEESKVGLATPVFGIYIQNASVSCPLPTVLILKHTLLCSAYKLWTESFFSDSSLMELE